MLGLFRAAMSANGDVVVTEDRLRALVSGASTAEMYADAIRLLLGAEWDAELLTNQRQVAFGPVLGEAVGVAEILRLQPRAQRPIQLRHQLIE